MNKNIERELQRLKEDREKIETVLKNSPEGYLKWKKKKGTFQYYFNGKYLRKENRELAEKIAYRDYCKALLQPINEEIYAMEMLMKIYANDRLADVYRNLKLGRKVLVCPLFTPIEDIIREFNEISYEGKPFDEQDVTEYYTMKNERVRSKSEKIIADELYMQEIPYHYELPIQLENRGRIVTVYPDFTALNKRTGQKWIVEHLGMMDKEAYYESTMYKLDLYERNGWLQGRNLILLHESSAAPLSTMVLKQYIAEFLC